MAPSRVDRADGYWGENTATIDWCEENYVVSHYVAEFWNTISNVIMIIPPIFLIIKSIEERLEFRLILCYLSLLMVGIGSWFFHMTLLYGMQLLDELPMIWGTALLVYAFSEITSPPKRENQLLRIFLFVYCFVVTAVYLLIKNPVFHEAAYGFMVVWLIVETVRVVRNHDYNIALVLSGSVFYTIGFILWNIDNNFCPQIRKVRHRLGSVGPLSQLHAWWHLLAGIGTYISILFCVHTRYLYLKRSPQVKVWLKFWPYVTIPRCKGEVS